MGGRGGCVNKNRRGPAPEVLIFTLSRRNFLKIYTLFWSINQCYCYRTMELLSFYRFSLLSDNKISKTKGFLVNTSQVYLVLGGNVQDAWRPEMFGRKLQKISKIDTLLGRKIPKKYMGKSRVLCIWKSPPPPQGM